MKANAISLYILMAVPTSSYSSYRFGEDLIWYEEMAEIHSEGKTVHRFRKDCTNKVAIQGLGNILPDIMGMVFGGSPRESETEVYRSEGSGYSLVEKKSYGYTTVDEGTAYGGLYIKRERVQSSVGRTSPDFDEEKYLLLTPLLRYEYGERDIYTVRSYNVSKKVTRLTSVTTTEYTGNGQYTVTEKYSWLPATQLRSSVTVSNAGGSIRTETFYTDSVSTMVARAMNDANVRGTVTGGRETSGTSVQEYRLANASMRSGLLFRPTSLRYRSGSGAYVTAKTYTWNTDGTLKSWKGNDGVTTSYTWDGNGHVVSKNAIVMSRFPGGFFDSAGSPYYYLTDFQGNNIGVYDKTGKLVQRTDYYASGEPWLEPVYGSGAAGNRYLFGGKERLAGGALNEYDFEARNYVASFQRFTTIDPEAEKFPWLSPYAYCNANPINFIDPTGAHTQVTLKSPGVYEVVGGELDDDLNVYLYCKNEDGELVNTGISIGETTSATSFYYSEENMWAIGSEIDLKDPSGIDFLDMIMNHTPSLPEYMDKARNFHPYDFKTTNGTDHVISDKLRYKYRGMQIGTIGDKPLISSARDIGNMAAGYVAGSHGLPWGVARLGFDGYQTISNGKINFEGISTVNAERYGWKIGFYGTSPIRKIINYEKSRASLFYKSVSLGIKFSINQILH